MSEAETLIHQQQVVVAKSEANGCRLTWLEAGPAKLLAHGAVPPPPFPWAGRYWSAVSAAGLAGPCLCLGTVSKQLTPGRSGLGAARRSQCTVFLFETEADKSQ